MKDRSVNNVKITDTTFRRCFCLEISFNDCSVYEPRREISTIIVDKDSITEMQYVHKNELRRIIENTSVRL